MLNVKEFRIGNAFEYKFRTPGLFTTLQDGNDIDTMKDDPFAEPIELTADILNTVLNRQRTTMLLLHFTITDKITVVCKNSTMPTGAVVCYNKVPFREIKYLHELQNIYFAMRGCDLDTISILQKLNSNVRP